MPELFRGAELDERMLQIVAELEEPAEAVRLNQFILARDLFVSKRRHGIDAHRAASGHITGGERNSYE